MLSENEPSEMLPGDTIVAGYNDGDEFLISPVRAARYGLFLIQQEQNGIRPTVPDDVDDPYYKMFMPAIN